MKILKYGILSIVALAAASFKWKVVPPDKLYVIFNSNPSKTLLPSWLWAEVALTSSYHNIVRGETIPAMRFSFRIKDYAGSCRVELSFIKSKLWRLGFKSTGWTTTLLTSLR